MSGGHFEYDQYKIRTIAETIESELLRQGKPKSKDELWSGDEYYEKYPEENFHYTYPKEVQEKFKEGVRLLKLAEVYAQRIDWLLSDDDGEESFLRRLKEDLSKIE